MNIEIKELEKSDFKKAAKFASDGMNFSQYVKNDFLLRKYEKYFFLTELINATQVIAAYSDGKLAGVLMAQISGEKKVYSLTKEKIFTSTVNLFQKLFFSGGVSPYNKANKKMYAEFIKNGIPDGEIIFLAADPEHRKSGIGTFLLNELERREKGKLIYLYTDSNCSFEFYDRRGFILSGKENITMKLGGENQRLTCFLYSKKL